MRRIAILVAALLAASATLAQGTGAWNVESEADLFSFRGLGSAWLQAHQHPTDQPAADAVLVIGCDPESPNGYEVSAWVAASAFPLTPAASGEVEVLVRFDQGPIATQTWFLNADIGVQEAVAYYEFNEALFAGLASAGNLALRVQADAAAGVPERTFQYDVRGFVPALAQLRCGEAPEASDLDDGAIGDWLVTDEGDGIFSPTDFGAVGIYCVAGGNGIEIDVGPYDLTEGDVYDVVFRSGNVDFLTTPATVGPFGAAQLPDDATEERLVRFLRGVLDVSVRMTPRRPGGSPLSFTTGTRGFNDAFAVIGCR